MDSKKIYIEAGTLIVLSGLQGSGKSSLRARAVAPVHSHPDYVNQVWLAADDLRVRLLGTVPEMDRYGIYEDVSQAGNPEIFAILRQMVQLRLRMGLTAVVDACNPTEADRDDWIALAKECGAPYKVLILDTSLEDCLAANQQRTRRVPEYRIHAFNQPEAQTPKQVTGAGKPVPMTPPAEFTRTSAFPHQVISRGDTLVFTWPELMHSCYDVVGDTHGLFDELLELLRKAGWVYEKGKLSHPQGRKLLLLGDLVDRGLQSLELVRFARQAVADGVAEVIAGNHEAKLVKFYRQFHDKGVSSWGSYANAETGITFVKAKDGAALIEFLDKLPTFKTFVNDNLGLKLLFVHANLLRAYPGVTPQDDFLYGQTGFERMDTDQKYQEAYDLGINAWTLIRGHIPQTSDQANVFSLERHPFQKGELVLLRLDSFQNSVAQGLSQRDAFHANLMTQQCDFDFDGYSAKYQLARDMNALVSAKMATAQVNDDNTLRAFKYSKDTFFKNRWGEAPALVKARGLVLNAAGEIVSHPFDKVFNLHENGTGDEMTEDTSLVVVDKLNGFLGIIDDHPFKSSELLVHTQGSFKGEFVDFINEYVTPQAKGMMKKYLSRNNVTLTFEVIHPQDPHIIEYAPSEHGLWLLGVRGKNVGDLAWPEAAVDEAAATMGLRRPKWTRMTKRELLALCRDDEGLAKVEGWMAREDSAEQLHLLKLKTPYYLVTKFLGRLSSKRIAHLFGSPRDFKKTIDEEFFPLVDALAARLTKEQMLEMPDDERVAFVRGLVHELI